MFVNHPNGRHNPDGPYVAQLGQKDGLPLYGYKYPEIDVNRLFKDAIMPVKGSSGAAGFDLFANEDVRIGLNGGRRLIKTGISMAIPQGFYGRIAPCSDLALKNGIDVLAGVIDSDYTGDIGVVLINHDYHTDFYVRKGDKIAQIIIEKIGQFELVENKNCLPTTERGAAGLSVKDKPMTDKPLQPMGDVDHEGLRNGVGEVIEKSDSEPVIFVDEKTGFTNVSGVDPKYW